MLSLVIFIVPVICKGPPMSGSDEEPYAYTNLHVVHLRCVTMLQVLFCTFRVMATDCTVILLWCVCMYA